MAADSVLFEKLNSFNVVADCYDASTATVGTDDVGNYMVYMSKNPNLEFIARIHCFNYVPVSNPSRCFSCFNYIPVLNPSCNRAKE